LNIDLLSIIITEYYYYYYFYLRCSKALGC